MPNYRFNDVKEEFYRYLDKNKKLGKAAVLKYSRDKNRKRREIEPAESTLYKWYNAR